MSRLDDPRRAPSTPLAARGRTIRSLRRAIRRGGRIAMEEDMIEIGRAHRFDECSSSRKLSGSARSLDIGKRALAGPAAPSSVAAARRGDARDGWPPHSAIEDCAARGGRPTRTTPDADRPRPRRVDREPRRRKIAQPDGLDAGAACAAADRGDHAGRYRSFDAVHRGLADGPEAAPLIANPTTRCALVRRGAFRRARSWRSAWWGSGDRPARRRAMSGQAGRPDRLRLGEA